jgi:hypothetical protein
LIQLFRGLTLSLTLFLAILARFLEYEGDTYVIREVLLDVVHSSKHTGADCCRMILNVLKDYNIKLSRIAAIASDNASACDKMIELTNHELSKIDPTANSKILPAFCFAHAIHRVVLFMLTPITIGLKKARAAIAKTCMSSSMTAEFQDQIRVAAIRTRVKFQYNEIQLDCPTRWNSTAQMLKHLLILRVPFSEMLRVMGEEPIADEEFKTIGTSSMHLYVSIDVSEH